VALSRETCRPGARRSASGSVVAPARRMSSAVMTNTEAAASDSGSARLDTEVISMAPSSSRLISRRRASDACCAWPAAAKPVISAARTAGAARRGDLDIGADDAGRHQGGKL
jgi:hypothetical protein